MGHVSGDQGLTRSAQPEAVHRQPLASGLKISASLPHGEGLRRLLRLGSQNPMGYATTRSGNLRIYDFPSQARSVAASCFADSDAPAISEGALRCHVDCGFAPELALSDPSLAPGGGDGYLGTGKCSCPLARPQCPGPPFQSKYKRSTCVEPWGLARFSQPGPGQRYQVIIVVLRSISISSQGRPCDKRLGERNGRS